MIVAVVLAAGASSRFGSPKQGVLLAPVVARVREAQTLDDAVVVVGAHEIDTDTKVVNCPEWELGPGASLRCGLEALAPDVEAAVVVLADGPNLSPAAIDRVVADWRAGAGDILAASYSGVRGHPVLLARSVWPHIPDEGARALEPVLVPCDDLGAPGDVNYPEDLPERFRAETPQ